MNPPTPRTRLVAPLAALVATALLVGATPAAAQKGQKKKRPATLTVLVTNDDGVDAPGIDAVVEALRAEKRTKVAVVAPAGNNSGVGGRSTPGGALGAPATTASGYAAIAVAGFPVDAVDHALDVAKVKPHLVISGSNHGQNLGPVVHVSGTIGAARQAARRGVPALAVSSQLGDAPDFPTSARLAVEWLREERKQLLKRKAGPGAPLNAIASINTPTCPGGAIRGVYETVPAPQGTPDAVTVTSDCASTTTSFPNDVSAFNQGWATLTEVPLTDG